MCENDNAADGCARPRARVTLVNHPPVEMPWESPVSLTADSAAGAFVWGIDGHRAQQLIDRLARGQDPGTAPAEAWAVVLRQPDGSVVVTSAPAYIAGMVWSQELVGGVAHLHVGPFLGGVVQARQQPTTLDPQFAAAKFGRPTGDSGITPFAEVHRSPAGSTLRWPSISDPPRVSVWSGPDAWPDPTLSGEGLIDQYRRTFDQVVDALVPADGPLFATLSGGLDSSFVVASLMRHARGGRTVEAFVHSPHPDAKLVPRGIWDPDDYEIALSMRSMYPSALNIHRVINEERRQPLDQAERSARRLWYPTPNTFNHLWLRLMDERVGEMGGDRLFFGASGNSAFSYDHPYAARYHAGRGEWADVAQIARPYAVGQVPGVRTGPSHAVRFTGAYERAAWRLRRQPPDHPWHSWVPTAEPQRWVSAGTARERYLRWLSSTDHRGLTAAFAGWTAPMTDPFSTQPIQDLAVAIKPSAWVRAGAPRGFARLVAKGRLPDEIRLRTRRGGQSWDAWYVIHDQRDRYVAEAELLCADPMLGPYVDGDALRATLDSWPWGQPAVERTIEVNSLTEMLAFGVAWRTLRQMLASVRS